MKTARLPIALALSLAAGLMSMPAQAGTVEVRYDAGHAHSDAGATPAQREKNLAALSALLRSVGEPRLPANQTLEIELLDVDLTGTMRLSRHPVGEVRIVTGRADGPRIRLRYTLREAGAVVTAGEETLYDAALPRLGDARDSTGGEPLRHERSLIDHWFAQRFGMPQ